MYDELYDAWRVEIENPQLGSLPSDFYSRVADYLRRIKEENRMLDKKSLKSILLEQEQTNVRRITHELVWTRYRKLAKMIVDGHKVPMDSLAAEEAQLCGGIVPSANSYGKFAGALLQGQITKIEAEAVVVHKRTTLRFLKPVPSIIGVDMQTYGPFMVEDVASVPLENAKILVKQGLAVPVEVS